jgi:AraC family transcriptional regulator
VGEALGAFVTRVRLERALYLLSHRPGTSFTELALACGFSSSSSFSRSFRRHFGVSPRRFDVERFRAVRREEMQLTLAPPEERHRLDRLPPGDNPDGFRVRIRDVPSRRVAYLRVRRPYEPGRVLATAEWLLDWARKRGLARGQWLGYQWEDPEIVPLEKCRYDVGLVVPESASIDGGVGETRFEAMKVAEIEIAGSVELELRALDFLYRTWLPRSGYAPDHQPAFEAWNGEPFSHGQSHFEIRVQLPVVDADRPI